MDLLLTLFQNEYEHLLDKLSVHISHHKFSIRSSKFPQISKLIFAHARQLLEYIARFIEEEEDSLLKKTVLNLTSPNNSTKYSTTHQTKNTSFLHQLQQLQLSILKKFSLLVESQPPPVFAVSSPQSFSLKFVPLPGVVPNVNFDIKTYLVHESTVVDIQTKDFIPDDLETCLVAETPPKNESSPKYKTPSKNGTHPNIEAASEKESRPRNNNQKLGIIFLDGTGSCNGVHVEQTSNLSPPTKRLKPTKADKSFDKPKKSTKAEKSFTKQQRSSKAEKPFANVPGDIFQNLNGCLFSNQSCYCFNRRLVVKDKPNVKNIAATAKFCLLFVLDIEFIGKKHKVWTFSLPFCVTTHSSQYEQVWLEMVWYEVVAEHKKGKLDFQVGSEATWPKVKQMFTETSNLLTGKPLDDDQLEFLRKKTVKLTQAFKKFTIVFYKKKLYDFMYFK